MIPAAGAVTQWTSPEERLVKIMKRKQKKIAPTDTLASTGAIKGRNRKLFLSLFYNERKEIANGNEH